MDIGRAAGPLFKDSIGSLRINVKSRLQLLFRRSLLMSQWEAAEPHAKEMRHRRIVSQVESIAPMIESDEGVRTYLRKAVAEKGLRQHR